MGEREEASPSDDLRWLAYALATTSQASVRSLVGSSLSLGAHQSERVLCAEHMAMQVGDPLAPRRGDVQVGDSFLQVGRDTVPVEVGIALDQVGRRGIAELAVEADLLELVEQRVRLLQVERVSQLTDQVRCQHE